MNVPPEVFVTSITISINNDNWSIDVLHFSNINYVLKNEPISLAVVIKLT